MNCRRCSTANTSRATSTSSGAIHPNATRKRLTTSSTCPWMRWNAGRICKFAGCATTTAALRPTASTCSIIYRSKPGPATYSAFSQRPVIKSQLPLPRRIILYKGLKRKWNEIQTLRFVHFSTFYSIWNLFDQIDIDWYRILIWFKPLKID